MDHKHSDWEKEQKRVNEVTGVIEDKQLQMADNTGTLKEDIIDLRKNFWEDVTVNFDETDDVIETYASIKQQAELLSERERSHGQFSRTAKIFARMKSSPYFGRFDFREKGGSAESYYIGVSSLMDQNDEDFLIYDWRAPVASLYYDYPPGPASYDTPDGAVDGDMDLKRQFIIEKGSIQGMFNTGMTIGDDLLKKVLGGQANDQMKSIVATIQKEQNAIIRNENSRLLLVQGVAGSGKTSAAMQRIAYLLYRHRKQVTADQILLFSPNQMFSSYVASVLPELGEENMQQSTFQEYLQKRLDAEFTLESPFQQIEATLIARRNEESSLKEQMHQYKSGEAFKNMIDSYIESLSQGGLLFRNVKFRGEIRFAASEIKNYFYQLDQAVSIANRMELVRDWLLDQLKKIEQEEISKDWPEEEAAFLDKEDYMKVYHQLEEKQKFNEDTFDDFIKEEQGLKSIVVKRKLAPLKKRINEFKFIQTRLIYSQLFDWGEAADNTPAFWNELASYTKQQLQDKYLSVEDQTPYLYLQDRLEGRKINPTIRYVLLDEAQDYSIFQYAYIREMFPYAQFTLLGDYHQAIYSHNHGQSTILSEDVHGGSATKYELLTSYRSTRPIVEFTKHILPDGDNIQAFNRDGALPRIHEIQRADNYIEKVVETARNRIAEGQETIAILCYTSQESRQVYNQVKDLLPATLIYKETQPFQKGLLILPVYLAKGIEFDGVIVYDTSSMTYHREEDRLLLYTACTRAMHELDLFYEGEMSQYIKAIPEALYHKKTTVQL